MTEKHKPISGNLAESLPFIKTEQVNDVKIGRIDLPIDSLDRWLPSETAFKLIGLLEGSDSKSTSSRSHLLSTLNNNIRNSDPNIAHERAVSAYFTYDPNPRDEKVIVEWGTINPNSKEAKLHTFLNNSINFAERFKQGMRISSGHLARLIGTKQYIALLDNLIYGNGKENLSPQAKKTINTLHANGIIVITADGHIQLPVF